MEAIKFSKFITVLDECGWAYSGFSAVENKTTGRSGFRYRLEEYGCKRTVLPFEELKRRLLKSASVPEDVIFGTAQYRYAPEIRNHTVIILD